MSLDLKDLRTKITPETWAFLSARAEAGGKEVSEIAREVLHGWALREAHAFKVAQSFCGPRDAQGFLRAAQGR